MGREYARIKTSLWNDDAYLALSRGAQLTYQLILEQSELTLCGVLQPSCRRWAGYCSETSVQDIEKDINELAHARFIIIDEDTDELLVRSFVRYDIALASENALVGMSKAFQELRSKDLRKVVIEELRKVDDKDLLDRVTRPIPNGDKKPLRDRLTNDFVAAWEGAY